MLRITGVNVRVGCVLRGLLDNGDGETWPEEGVGLTRIDRMKFVKQPQLQTSHHSSFSYWHGFWCPLAHEMAGVLGGAQGDNAGRVH